MTAYHMPTRWIWPCGPYVATVEERCWWRNSTTSSWLITICARWLATRQPPNAWVAVTPPSIAISAPLMYDDSSLPRKT